MQLKYGPGALCRIDDELRRDIAGERDLAKLIASCVLAILIGSMCYGAVFGIWRSPIQALYSALKMPLLIYFVTLVSIVLNTMLAQVLGSGLSFRQVGTCILLSFAITSILLCAFSPVSLFFTLQTKANDMDAYGRVLFGHTAVIGFCGVVGTVRLYQLLRALNHSMDRSLRLLACWIFVAGLAGCELSWVLSPFLAKPGIAIPFINPDAFNGNFFEYLWKALQGGL